MGEMASEKNRVDKLLDQSKMGGEGIAGKSDSTPPPGSLTAGVTREHSTTREPGKGKRNQWHHEKSRTPTRVLLGL